MLARTRLVVALSVLLFGGVASADPSDAAEENASCGLYCVYSCPPYPNLLCQSYGCQNSGSCAYESCGTQQYAVQCKEPD